MFGLYGDLPEAKTNDSRGAQTAEAAPPVWSASRLKPALKRPVSSEAPAPDLRFAPRPTITSISQSGQSAHGHGINPACHHSTCTFI